jgi:hypothetical protein
VGDATVSPGGAKVNTDGGEIDATIETQLDNVVEALLGSRVSQAQCGSYVPTVPAPIEIEQSGGLAHGQIADCVPARRERIADSPHVSQQAEESQI